MASPVKPPITQHQYLGLDKILSAQKPQSFVEGRPVHDEMLFIISQEIGELWFKQILFELDSVIEIFGASKVDERQLGTVITRLHRITLIQENLLHQIRILETMTPLDLLEFRDLLTTASGIQSEQYWTMNRKWGVSLEGTIWENKQKDASPTLFDLIQAWLERTPFLKFQGFDFWSTYRAAVEETLERDDKLLRAKEHGAQQHKTLDKEIQTARINFEAILDEKKHDELRRNGQHRFSHKAMQAALLIYLYRDEPILQLPYKLLTLLIDIDDLFSSWRNRHATVVLRMIGTKLGSYDTSGYSYLKSTVDSRRVFNDLPKLSTYLVSRSSLPPLPADVERGMNFAYAGKKP